MICNKCGRQIGIEDKKCPYCGNENAFAIKHEKDMQKYGKRFDKTSEKVIDTAKSTNKLGIKAAVIVALLIVIIVTRLISANNYADHESDDKGRTKICKDVDKNIARIDEMLASGQYEACYHYIGSHMDIDFDNEPYEGLHRFYYTTRYYIDSIKYLEMLVFHSTNPDYWDSTDSDSEFFSQSITEFYKTYDGWVEDSSDNKYRDYIFDMETELRTAVKVYLDMDDAEFEEFLTLSDAKKAVKVEEVFHNEEE